ncbi:MAG: DsbA family protein [Elainellaceae cyanobacterium]
MSHANDLFENSHYFSDRLRYDTAPSSTPIFPDDHTLGCSSAKVKVIQYGDYQCSHCIKAHKIVKSIQMKVGNQILFVFRHFPRSDIHPFAQHAAEAAEAACSQQRFWQMHDRLFDLNAALDDASLVEHAIALNLSISQFLKEMKEDLHVKRVLQHIEIGRRIGVSRTPTFFINDLCLEGDIDELVLLAAIQHKLQL